MDITRKLATLTRIEALHPIPNADAIECATIGGWHVVVAKSAFAVGDWAVYFEIDSLIPRKSWSEFLFGTNSGQRVHRLRTVRLRGQISQGLLIPASEIPELADLPLSEHLDADLTERLGVTKFLAPIPAALQASSKGSRPSFVPKTDEPRLQSNMWLLPILQKNASYVTLKYDGTSFSAYRWEGTFGVCSRNMDLKQGENAYWNLATALCLPDTLPEGFVIQGEMCGPNIQNNRLGLLKNRLFVFNIWDITAQRYLPLDDMLRFVNQLRHSAPELETVALLAEKHTDPYELADWLEVADNARYPNGAIAEGIVIRTHASDRLSCKVISNNFLLKHGE